MAPQAYKVVIIHVHEISGYTILSIIVHVCAPYLGGMDGDSHSDLSTLAFKKVKQLEGFHSIIPRLQQEIILSLETVSPTRLLFQYSKALSKRNKFKESVTPNMTYLIAFLNNNGK